MSPMTAAFKTALAHESLSVTGTRSLFDSITVVLACLCHTDCAAALCLPLISHLYTTSRSFRTLKLLTNTLFSMHDHVHSVEFVGRNTGQAQHAMRLAVMGI